MNDQELLIKALAKMDMTHLEDYEGRKWCCDLSRSTNCKVLAPALLTSLDSHFAPGGTVEWMAKLEYELSLSASEIGWMAKFQRYLFEDFNILTGDDPNPAKRLTQQS